MCDECRIEPCDIRCPNYDMYAENCFHCGHKLRFGTLCYEGDGDKVIHGDCLYEMEAGELIEFFRLEDQGVYY